MSYDCGFRYTCVKIMTSPAIFFHFFKILIFFWFLEEGEGHKMTHNYQFQPLTLNISRTVDHIFGAQV